MMMIIDDTSLRQANIHSDEPNAEMTVRHATSRQRNKSIFQ